MVLFHSCHNNSKVGLEQSVTNDIINSNHESAVKTNNTKPEVNQYLYDCDSLVNVIGKSSLKEFRFDASHTKLWNIEVDQLNKVDSELLIGRLFQVDWDSSISSESPFYYYSVLEGVLNCSVLFYREEIIDNVQKELYLVDFNSQGEFNNTLLLAQRIPFPDGSIEKSSAIIDSEIHQIKKYGSIGELDAIKGEYREIIDSVNLQYALDVNYNLILRKKDSVRIFN